MKRIIVPIDFSQYADNAFLSALKIAHKTDASITCINVVNSQLDWDNFSPDQKSKYNEILDQEAEAKDKLRSYVMDHKLGGVPVEPIVSVGVPHVAILKMAEKQKADLIVIGAYGAGHVSGKFIGSNLQKVLRNSNCPVLAVKKALNGNHLRKMVFASLFNEDARPAFVKMKPVLKDFQTSVHFLFVNTPNNFTNSGSAEDKMAAFAKGFEDLVIHKNVYNHKEVEAGIVEFAIRNQMGFIGIVSNDRKSSYSYQIGVTDTVLNKSDICVLSVKID